MKQKALDGYSSLFHILLFYLKTCFKIYPLCYMYLTCICAFSWMYSILLSEHNDNLLTMLLLIDICICTMDMLWYLTQIFICISLIPKNIKYFFTCLFNGLTCELPVQGFLPIFFQWVAFVFLLIFAIPLYIIVWL